MSRSPTLHRLRRAFVCMSHPPTATYAAAASNKAIPCQPTATTHTSANLNAQTTPPTFTQNDNITSSSSGPYAATEYTRRPYHTPNTTSSESEDHYILTLHTSPSHHAALTALRNQYFPSHLNKLAAHIALFRALPGSQLPAIESAILDLCAQTTPFEITTKKAFLLSKHGVGINVQADPARGIHSALKEQWKQWLSGQDRGGFRPHYTIQNKVDIEVAKHTLAEVQEKGVEGIDGEVDGLTLWRYDKGYWKDAKTFPFGAGEGGYAGT